MVVGFLIQEISKSVTASSRTTTGKMKDAPTSLLSLTVAPAQVLRGDQALELQEMRSLSLAIAL
jgi:hypothetical protein